MEALHKKNKCVIYGLRQAKSGAPRLGEVKTKDRYRSRCKQSVQMVFDKTSKHNTVTFAYN